MWKVVRWPIIYFVVQFLLTFFLAYYYINSGNDIASFNTYFNTKQIYVAIILGIIFIPLLNKEFNKYKEKGDKISLKFLIIIGIIISLLYNVIAFYLNDFIFKTNLYSKQNNILVTLITTGIIGPIIEELMFRGIIYNELKLKFPSMKAILLSTLIFAIIHLNILQILYAFAVGFLLIFVYEKYKNIKASIVLHMTLNMTTTLYLPLLITNNFILNYSVLILSLIVLFVILKYTKFFKM